MAAQFVSFSLERALSAIWPRRSQQEQLLDLGENKKWSSDERRLAIESVADWVSRNLELPLLSVGHRDIVSDVQVLADARKGIPGRRNTTNAVGVARWISEIAPALGSTPKTIANSLPSLKSDRADHRWLRAIARVGRGEDVRGAWCFHRRTPSSIAECVASWGNQTSFDAGDAVVLLSLLALWQRRRATSEVRSNRGVERRRSATPKPIAALGGTLIQPAQVEALMNVARRIDGGSDLALLAIEAALTEAHLTPHRPRSRARGSSGEQWLKAVEAMLRKPETPIEREDRGVFEFRLSRMRAWRDLKPQASAPAWLEQHPYVRASAALEWRQTMTFASDSPGVLMLLPQLRARAMVKPR